MQIAEDCEVILGPNGVVMRIGETHYRPEKGFAGLLYMLKYCDSRTNGHTSSATEIIDFVNSLSRANSGTGSIDYGWKIQCNDQCCHFTVSKFGISLRVHVNDLDNFCKSENATITGSEVGIRVPKEFRFLVPGYYMALGNATHPTLGTLGGGVIRLYINLSAETAATFIEITTCFLNERLVPFRAKVVNDPNGFHRRDAAVLYLMSSSISHSLELVRMFENRFGEKLRPNIPLFTKPASRGVGLAFDPGGGESFGQHRCRLAAIGLYEAFCRGATSPEARWRILRETFSNNGVDPDAPYRRSNDPLAFI